MAESAAAGLRMHPTAAITDEVILGFLDDMKAVLIAAGITTPIYTGWQPPSPDTCITLNEYAGRPPETLVMAETPGLQAVIRQAEGENDYQRARMLANSVFNTLHDKKNFAAGHNTYIHALAQQSPYFLERDINNRPIFIINFLVRKERK